MKFSHAFTITMLSVFILALLSSPVNAYGVWACDQTGTPKTSFYTNESVYVTGGNITASSQSVRIYKTLNNNSWVDGQEFSDFSGSYITATTNASGYLPITSLWDDPEIGDFDIVADINSDGIYNSSDDFLNSSSIAGFSVAQAPIPTLTIDTGSDTPSSHDWDLDQTGHNEMLQILLTATVEPIRIESLSLTADGSGNDEEGIMVVYLILDQENNGEYDQGEMILAYSQYLFDNGVATLELEDIYIIPVSESVNMLITYSMSSFGEIGDTYQFDLVAVSASGDTSGENADIVGLPIGSAIKTISAEADTTTTTTLVNTTTTTTVPTDECETDTDCGGISCNNKQKTTYSCEYDENKGVNVCASTIVMVDCCGDADCTGEYYCLNYECVRQGGGGIDVGGWIGGEAGGYITVIISIVVVSVIVVAILLFIKNRKKNPWKSKREYESEWDRLKGKWKRK